MHELVHDSNSRQFGILNQGYNFGHGQKHLVTVFAYQMMLAFLLDQIQQRCCTLLAKAQAERARYYWDKVSRLFLTFPIADRETLYRTIAFGYRGEMVVHDTS